MLRLSECTLERVLTLHTDVSAFVTFHVVAASGEPFDQELIVAAQALQLKLKLVPTLHVSLL